MLVSVVLAMIGIFFFFLSTPNALSIALRNDTCPKINNSLSYSRGRTDRVHF